MLLRRYPPNQGLWNGVGGHIEPGETPLPAILREVHEETGFRILTARYAGILIWSGYEIKDGGLHIFTAPAPEGDPVANHEGTLDWKPISWVLTSPQVVSNIHHFLLPVLAGAPPQLYRFEYARGEMISRSVKPL